MTSVEAAASLFGEDDTGSDPFAELGISAPAHPSTTVHTSSAWSATEPVDSSASFFDSVDAGTSDNHLQSNGANSSNTWDVNSHSTNDETPNGYVDEQGQWTYTESAQSDMNTFSSKYRRCCLMKALN